LPTVAASLYWRDLRQLCLHMNLFLPLRLIVIMFSTTSAITNALSFVPVLRQKPRLLTVDRLVLLSAALCDQKGLFSPHRLRVENLKAFG